MEGGSNKEKGNELRLGRMNFDNEFDEDVGLFEYESLWDFELVWLAFEISSKEDEVEVVRKENFLHQFLGFFLFSRLVCVCFFFLALTQRLLSV